ncbi:alpha/beta hydrolase [Georgenia faecalis]|uniref:Alpha/beta hydrolase n=1 Tax=Georgenia faecalis TaxID=2483799 RepID=A0ABV9D7W2_9MICO|nr:alpha/beta fold hydrolase [Georgenia faecalis]
MVATIAGALVVVAVGLVGALWFGQRALIYHPDGTSPPPAAAVLPDGRDVVLRTSDGLELGAYHRPPSPGCATTVLVTPGNGGNRGGRAPLARALAEQGFGVLLLDYRGYGGNPGAPTEQGLARDARAARTFLLAEGVAPDALVYLGESLGAAVAAELAAAHPPAALVLRSPFTTLAAAGQAAYGLPVGVLLRDRYPVVDHVAQVRAPTAVVYGTADTIVPADQSREVARTARKAGVDVVEVTVDGGGHNDPEVAQGRALIDALVEVTGRCGT